MAADEGHNTRHRSGDGKTGGDARDAAGSNTMAGFRTNDVWEIAAAVVLSLATLVSAWSGYQSARWSSENVKANRAATAARIALAACMFVAATAMFSMPMNVGF